MMPTPSSLLAFVTLGERLVDALALASGAMLSVLQSTWLVLEVKEAVRSDQPDSLRRDFKRAADAFHRRVSLRVTGSQCLRSK